MSADPVNNSNSTLSADLFCNLLRNNLALDQLIETFLDLHTFRGFFSRAVESDFKKLDTHVVLSNFYPTFKR